MSKWAHIVASIDVDTYIESNTIESDVKEMLKKAPKITGSEEDAHIFVNVLPGYNVTSCYDCRRCEHCTREYIDDGEIRYGCCKPEGCECPEIKYQTRVVITVIGDLRDTEIPQTEKEWIAFKKFIDEEVDDRGFYIRNCACNIVDYWGVGNV